MCIGAVLGVMAAVADAEDRVTAGLPVSPAAAWALEEVQPANSKAASTAAMNTRLSCPAEWPATEQVAVPDGQSGLDPVDSLRRQDFADKDHAPKPAYC